MDPFRYQPRDRPATVLGDEPVWSLWLTWAVISIGGFVLGAWLIG